MESVSCIICGSDNNSIYKKIKDKLNPLFVFNIVKCNCGFIYLNPRPDSNEISKYYDNLSSLSSSLLFCRKLNAI